MGGKHADMAVPDLSPAKFHQTLSLQGGNDAVALKVAESYIDAFRELAKKGTTLLLPAQVGWGVGGVGGWCVRGAAWCYYHPGTPAHLCPPSLCTPAHSLPPPHPHPHPHPARRPGTRPAWSPRRCPSTTA